jgi:hypothetical protein
MVWRGSEDWVGDMMEDVERWRATFIGEHLAVWSRI